MKTVQHMVRRYTIAEVDIHVDAPKPIVDVLDVTLARVPQSTQEGQPVVLTVRAHEDRWEIGTRDDRLKVLGSESPAAAVAGATTTAMAEHVAERFGWILVESVIVERDGAAVALVGPQWGTCVALAAHLSVRDWRIVTSRYAFVDARSLAVSPFSKLLYIPSDIIGKLPRQYRRALEASPWYANGTALGFYGVDPHRVTGGASFAHSATLRAAVVVRSDANEGRPHMTAAPVAEMTEHGGSFLGEAAEAGSVACGLLDAGEIVSTANLLEDWASAAVQRT